MGEKHRIEVPAADGTVHVFEKGKVTWFEIHEAAASSYPGQPAVALIKHALQQQATIDAQAERIRELETSRPLRDGSRLLDLVRYQRMELHEDGLITDEEYAELVNIDKSPRRLEEYDAIMSRAGEQAERVLTLEAEIERLKKHQLRTTRAWRKAEEGAAQLVTARRETATAIMRFAVTYAAKTENAAGQRVKVIGVDELVSICRAHGADV